MSEFEVKTGDAIAVSEFTKIGKSILAGFNAEKNRRYVMLLLGEQRQDEEFDPESMLRDLGWERKDDSSQFTTIGEKR